MGFAVGCTEVFLPKLYLQTLSVLGFIRTLLSSLFCFLGLSDFIETEPFLTDIKVPDCAPVSVHLIRELLPVMIFHDLVNPPTDSCVVCLYDFETGDEVRELKTCRHVFHRSCLDRWMDCNQLTCPLCRTRFVPDGLEGEFNQRLWPAAGVESGDLYCEYS